MTPRAHPLPDLAIPHDRATPMREEPALNTYRPSDSERGLTPSTKQPARLRQRRRTANQPPATDDGFLFHSESMVSAEVMWALLRQHAPAFLRESFVWNRARPNRLRVIRVNRIPAGVTFPEWHRYLQEASRLNEWWVTTAEVQIDASRRGRPHVATLVPDLPESLFRYDTATPRRPIPPSLPTFGTETYGTILLSDGRRLETAGRADGVRGPRGVIIVATDIGSCAGTLASTRLCRPATLPTRSSTRPPPTRAACPRDASRSFTAAGEGGTKSMSSPTRSTTISH